MFRFVCNGRESFLRQASTTFPSVHSISFPQRLPQPAAPYHRSGILMASTSYHSSARTQYPTSVHIKNCTGAGGRGEQFVTSITNCLRATVERAIIFLIWGQTQVRAQTSSHRIPRLQIVFAAICKDGRNRCPRTIPDGTHASDQNALTLQNHNPTTSRQHHHNFLSTNFLQN